jgi:hypothetical protein
VAETANPLSVSLADFVTWCASHIRGDEKGEAQLFLNQLFRAFGHAGLREAGATCEERIRKDGGGTAFADLVWKPVVLIEMKKRGADLTKHYRQAFDYWTRLVPGRPRYVVLCNFDEFWVYDFETQMDTPVDRLALVDLPRRHGPLAFLFAKPQTPVVQFNDHEQGHPRRPPTCSPNCSTTASPNARIVPRDTAQRFALQSLMCLFAEDIGLLEKYFFARLLDDCATPEQSFDLIGGLFVEMNTPGKTGGGRFKGVDYFNGGLFREPARIELDATKNSTCSKMPPAPTGVLSARKSSAPFSNTPWQHPAPRLRCPLHQPGRHHENRRAHHCRTLARTNRKRQDPQAP